MSGAGTSASAFWADIFRKTCTEIPRSRRGDVSVILPIKGKQMAGRTGHRLPAASVVGHLRTGRCRQGPPSLELSRLRAVSCSSWPWSSARARCPLLLVLQHGA